MRVEMDEGAGLVEVEVRGQPVKRPGVIVLYINRERIGRSGGVARGEDRGSEERGARAFIAPV